MKQLRRSNKNRIIAGVAGGLAEYIDIDVTLVRLVWILLLFAGGTGFFIYLICWAVFPESTEYTDPSEPFTGPDGPEPDERRSIHRRNLGILLIGVGLVFLIKNLIPWYFWEKTWPLLLVIIGLYILFSNRGGDRL